MSTIESPMSNVEMHELNYLRCLVNEQLDAAGNEILTELDKCHKPSGVEKVKVFVKERLSAAADECFVAVERVIRKYKQDIRDRYRLLDIALKPCIHLHRAEAKQVFVGKEAWGPHLNQEETELHIIKVEEELWTSQEGEQLQGMIETDFKVTNPKTEDGDDLKEPSLNTVNGKKDAKQLYVCKQVWRPSLDQEEPDLIQIIKVEKEELWTSQEGEHLQGLNEPDAAVTNPVYDNDDDWKEPGLNNLNTNKGSQSVAAGMGGVLHFSAVSQPTSGSKPNRARKTFGGLSQLVPQHVCTGETPYHCPQCGKRFSQLANLQRHHVVHTGEKPYHCQLCGKSFTQVSSLRTHQRVHTGEKPHQCQHCEKSFSHMLNLQTHLRVHSGEKPYLCQQCGKDFGRLSQLRSHQHLHTGEKPYYCEQCGKRFRHAFSLQIHQRVHTGEKPYHCQECGKSFRLWSSLQTHQRVHTGEKPYRCHQCEKCFSQSSQLHNHKRVHTGEKLFHCQQCEKSFGRLAQLQVHQRVHTKEKPYHCQQCGKSFAHLSSCKEHQRVHTGEKPYHCQQCGKRFGRLSQFQVHQRVHTREKPYDCQQCGKSFGHLSSLKVHQHIHTGEKPFHCQQCDKRFSVLGIFNRHKLIHIGDKP